jgi:HSP20 family protein
MKQRTADMFSDFDRIRERMEEAWRQVLGPPGAPRFGAPFIEPPIDVYETDGDVVLVADIAGISDVEVEVEVIVDGKTLTLCGQRKAPEGKPGRLYSQMEIVHGPFKRQILLPAEVNPDEARASYSQGMLEIVLPKVTRRVNRHVKLVVR